MGGTYQEGVFDFVGFVVGVVERDAIIDGSSVRDGDVLLGLPSSGVHTNGLSLVRKVFRIDEDPSVLRRHYSELGYNTLGEELLAPHRSYFRLLEPVLPKLKAIAHITGGGIVENVPRVLPEGMSAAMRRGTWREPPIFWILQEEGGIDTDEMFCVFNMGLGMVLAVSPDDASNVQDALPEAVVVGEVVRQKGDERVIIEHS
jgi:phosphoribosylformylglycinamidine cyclo-ligase